MRGVGAFAWLLVAALAGANEVCIDKQTGALSSGHFVVDPAPHSPKGQNCYSIHPPTKPARGFLDPMRIWDFATSASPRRPSVARERRREPFPSNPRRRPRALAIETGALTPPPPAAGQPWYNYCLLAWILSAVEKYFE